MVSTKSQEPHARFERVAYDIAREIESGKLEQGEKLPSEHDLAKKYGASRGTVRKALILLNDSELVHTKRGSGSYVAFHGNSLAGAKGWTAATYAAGLPTRCEVLSITEVELPKQIQRYTPHTEGYEIVRRRLLEDEPISLEISTLPKNEQIETIMQFGLLGNSISTTLRAAGMKVQSGFQDINVVNLPKPQAHLLELPEQQQMIFSSRVALDEKQQLVELVESWLSPQHFSLHLTFEEG